ncbi:MAG: hypothetical protein F6K58_18730 [Symploca sp. SIO2E9]|nr:hypothetical protein [Symploca sp. SIO2E9]
MNQQLSVIPWTRIGLVLVVGMVVWSTSFRAYHRWKIRDGWCARYHPDGSEEIFYGAQCHKFNYNPKPKALIE